MQINLSPLQKQVDALIDVRIARLAQAAFKQANILPNGKVRKKYKQVTLPAEVSQLLELRQKLYTGEDAEAIAATVTSGQYQESFTKKN